jgi:hypothetical protein
MIRRDQQIAFTYGLSMLKVYQLVRSFKFLPYYVQPALTSELIQLKTVVSGLFRNGLWVTMKSTI